MTERSVEPDPTTQAREDFGYADTLSLLRQLGVLRSLRLGVEVLIGRVKLPVPARRARPAS